MQPCWVLSFYDTGLVTDDGNTRSRVRWCVTRPTKKCPSRITTFNGSSVHGCGFRVLYQYWRQIYRLEENDSLTLSHLDASERIVIFESMKITLVRIDTEPRWNWHIHLSPGICMACMGKSRRGATSRDWPCIIHRISVERFEILNNKSGLGAFFRLNPAASSTVGCPRILHFIEISPTDGEKEREWECRPLISLCIREVFGQNENTFYRDIFGLTFWNSFWKL